MRSKILMVAAAVMFGACTFARPNDDVTLELNQTLVDIFARYNQERRNLSITELRQALEALPQTPSDEDLQHIEHLYGKIDVSKVTAFLAQNDPSSRTLRECLQSTPCGASALLTMKSWAFTQWTPLCVTRKNDGLWARIHFRGISTDGKSGEGAVDFISEDGQWKIGFQSFGKGSTKGC